MESSKMTEEQYYQLRDKRNEFRDLGEKSHGRNSYFSICKDYDKILEIYETDHPKVKDKEYIQQKV